MSTHRAPQIDNTVYDRLADTWWDARGLLNLLQSAINPWRVPYFQRILAQRRITPQSTRALDVGCGGGLLAEVFAALGFTVTGIDQSDASLAVARAHAALSGLRIGYQRGDAAALPFADATFEVVYCCDALEHLPDWDAALGEIARVLTPGGVFLYDTINRTRFSRIVTIHLLQDWPATRFFPPNLHVWRMFITPAELQAALERHGLHPQDARGIQLSARPRQLLQALRMLRAIRQYRAGALTSGALGQRIRLQEGSFMAANYMGYAVKEPSERAARP
ncbi:MAG: bifunctional 2-polyprenyl-6-hydroxyphenol methylase/3-demethylubiquinol 3-O-methyltransferase UbiG [Chloroflexota bacterium]|nr:bifunctional 2-polyprenyl-6-hydroxyphenol methylase/3-demethylubiquinol 3-O-methyltransferase UbiG [Chloroflexota bacterium]